ncbi:nuclear transport factor 2 family protein [Mycolicibacterium sp. 141076]|uniref:nuclear transport factor 2 family protein n=1 Tax=Mycolicibacterium sp. 141076 TaxID=3090599 RepID=UPI00299E65F4|nr:nuclear transport factor 2 family protein [Mycolicibacterium sp. 141076]MDX1878825.1 nuclear transport factor 2 family protein [Mycolicibacterium sp. 141076]
MSTPSDIATNLYAAFAAHDPAGLAALLHPDFTGRVSAGMPFGLGGDVDSPETMLSKVWGEAATHFEITPQPDEFVVVDDERIIAFGYYRGSSRATRKQYSAAFVHDITIRDGKVVGLVQITDTQRWHDALVAS